MRRETRQYVDEALATLDEKYRVVFVLRDIEELSTRETADILGITSRGGQGPAVAGPSDAPRTIDATVWRRIDASRPTQSLTSDGVVGRGATESRTVPCGNHAGNSRYERKGRSWLPRCGGRCDGLKSCGTKDSAEGARGRVQAGDSDVASSHTSRPVPFVVLLPTVLGLNLHPAAPAATRSPRCSRAIRRGCSILASPTPRRRRQAGSV